MVPEHFNYKQMGTIIKVVKQMPFFQKMIVPMSDEDALQVVKHLKYEYVPKGKAIRRAGKDTDRLCFIMCGKVVCALPQKSEETVE